ncbi:MAG: PAS domain S-box protein [Deltaproteobacteria bacterium]|nr:PAS domain S-box protein [Deltaproteobacteria bacterium]
MSFDKDTFSEQYTSLLAEYADSLDEAPLAAIESLGQKMVLSNTPPETIGEMHDHAIAELIALSKLNAERIRAASRPLMQLLISYGVAFRAMLARKEAENQLHLASRAIENTVDGIIITDASANIISVNRAFEQITGYPKQEAVGRKLQMLHSERQDRSVYRKMWKSVKETGQWQGRLWSRKKSGEEFPEYISITAIHANDGKLSNYVKVFSDLSEKLSLEQQFQQAQKMEAIGTLVGGIAHDFNNILAGITGNMYLAKRKIQQGEQLPEAVDKINKIERLCRQAAAMISQLLTFARKGIVEMQELSMNSFVEDSLKFVQVTIPENIRVIHDVTSEPVLIRGDITQLQQVLLNLLNNARNAVEDVPEPRIELKLSHYDPDDTFLTKHPEAEGKRFAHLSISDNGYGIAKKHLDQVFEPFYTTKEVGKGTGLGLSMVYGAVQSHSGFILVESEQDRGTTFHIYLPLIGKLSEDLKTTALIGPLEAKGETILLADDEQHVRETTAEVLESLGYKIIQTEDGRRGIEAFKAHQEEISLALLNVVMPHYSGIQLAKLIREVNPVMPIVFVTGYDTERMLGNHEQIQNSRMLIKPVQFDALSHTIRELLD